MYIDGDGIVIWFYYTPQKVIKIPNQYGNISFVLEINKREGYLDKSKWKLSFLFIIIQ